MTEERRAAAARILEVAQRRLEKFMSLQEADREDAAQQTVERVLDAMTAGVVTNLEAFSRRVAFHCAIDLLRKRKREGLRAPREGFESEESGAIPATESLSGPDSDAAPSPESLVSEKARIEVVLRIAPALWDLVEQAPDNYRRILVQRYREGMSLEEVALAELERRVGDGQIPEGERDEPLQYQKALSTVHTWHSRALRWLQRRVSDSWREVVQ